MKVRDGRRRKPPVETEIKLRVASSADARRALRRLGARRLRPRLFEDNLLLDDADRSLAASGRVLRLRRSGAQAWLTFKGAGRVRGRVKQREERETLVADPDALEAALAGLGFEPTFRYQKWRETWGWRDAEIVIDETPIGTYLEIEGPTATIHRTAEKLGYRRGDYLAESYVALFFASGCSGDMVFREPRARAAATRSGARRAAGARPKHR